MKRFSLVLCLCLGMVMVPAAFAGKGGSNTFFVGTSVGTNTSCTSPGFTSVQAAVDAAPAGGTVFVCNSVNPYSGPVVITKSLTLTGDPGTAIQAPAIFPTFSPSQLPLQFTTDNLFPPMPIVLVWGANVNVAISNLTLEGPFLVSDCRAQFFGVLVIGDGSVVMTGDAVTNIRPADSSLLGCQDGVGIQVGRRYWPNATFTFLVEDFVGHAVLMNNTVSGYEKNGVTIDGPGSTASISGNTVTGDGRDPSTAQNGIQISRGAGGDVRNNAVSGNAYTGGGSASSGGILVFGGWGDPLVTGVQVMKNILTNNDVGIYLNNFNDDATGPAPTQTNNKATNNTMSNDDVTNFCTAGFSGCFGFITYQVGVNDIGNNDKVINNDISGIGYINGANNPSAGIYILPVDTISFPTTAAKVHANAHK